MPGPVDRAIERLRLLCNVAMTSLPASGAGVSVPAEDRQCSLLSAADPASERLEELQFVLGEGPCLGVAATGRPVLVPDLDGEAPGRWPLYAAALQEAGMRAIFAFPLHVGAAQLGVLDIFRSWAGPLSGPSLSHAFTLADQAVAILLDGQGQAAGVDRYPADGASASPPVLFQAQGMVMIQIGGTLADAMARIRAHAFAHDRRLIDVALDIVARDLRLDHDG